MKLQKFRLIILLCFILFSVTNLTAQEKFDESYVEFRTAVYNSTKSTINEILSQYGKTVSLIDKNNLIESYIKNSQCDYLMGMYHIDILENDKAIQYFEKSLEWANKAIEIEPTAQGYLAYAETLAQICPLKPTSYLLANALKVPSIAKKAIKLDNRLGAARYLVCCVIVYAPRPLKNLNKGEKRFKEILKNDRLDEEDLFNVYKSLGYIYYQQKDYLEADKWFDKAAKIYPHNKFLLSMQNREYTKESFVDVEPVIDSILTE